MSKNSNLDLEYYKTNDVFIRKNEIHSFISIGKTKLDELISKGAFVEPIYLPHFNEPFFSLNEINKWMEEQKTNRKTKGEVS